MNNDIYIGISERGDAGLDLSWQNKLQLYPFSILITKSLNDNFIKTLMPHKDKIILHATITGYGGSILEPNVNKPEWSIGQLKKIIGLGFPLEQIVLRVDPIFCSDKGVSSAIKVIMAAAEIGVKRVRFSFLDLYPHVIKRFKENNIPVPAAKPSKDMITKIEEAIMAYPGLSFESCAEGFNTDIGCLSRKDFDIMGVLIPTKQENGQNRKYCRCLSCKKDLLAEKKQCPHKCLYCYWH